MDKIRERALTLLNEMTLDEKIGLLTSHQNAVERLGIEEFYIGTEVARGFVGRGSENYSTVFPQPIGLAGTFDTELMAQLGEIAGNEARAYYNANHLSSPCLWGPTVDMERHPLWGRTEEAYGEDVCLAGEMTRAYTETMAADNGEYVKTVPTLKHFCADNNEENRISCNAFLPLRLKYEYYYAAFMNAIKYGGARSVMTAYNEINGIPALCNPELDTILKDDWGMWFTVTDGGDLSQTALFHEYCHDHAEALAEALKAGCDIMTDVDELVSAAAHSALDRGLITESDIDRAVANTLYVRLRLGLLSEDCPYASITKDVLEDERSAEINLKAAREQVVLLKNDGILPINGAPKKIAVVGALADENLMDWYTGVFREPVSVVEGIRREFPDSEIITDSLWDRIAIKAPNGLYIAVHEDGIARANSPEITDDAIFEIQDWGEGWTNLFSVKHQKYITFGDNTLKLNKRTIYDWFTRETFNFKYTNDGMAIIEEYLGHGRMVCKPDGSLGFEHDIPVCSDDSFDLVYISDGYQRCVELTETCDKVIWCVGNYPVQTAKECFDRKTLRLNVQAEMLTALGDNAVMVLISSYPYAIGDFDSSVPAVVYTTHTGATLGTAVAETISGKNCPAGRLAMTWYASDLDLADIMDYDIERSGSTYMYFKGKPLYAFGYGLSYASFEYRNIAVSANSDGSLTARVTVKNTSGIDGDEVIQVYYSVPESAVSRPIRKLCAFARVHLNAGEERTAELTIHEHILQIYDVRAQRMMTESGRYVFSAGGSSDNLTVSTEIGLDGCKLSPRKNSFEAQYYDSAYGIEIRWARSLRQHYIAAKGWSGTAVYGGIDLGGKTQLRVTASGYLGARELTFTIDDRDYKIKLNASVSPDDISEYTLDISGCKGDSIKLNVPEYCAVADIEIS